MHVQPAAHLRRPGLLHRANGRISPTTDIALPPVRVWHPYSHSHIPLLQRPQEFGEFLAALAPVLSRLSFAFARVVLICEGGPGFQAQVRPSWTEWNSALEPSIQQGTAFQKGCCFDHRMVSTCTGACPLHLRRPAPLRCCVAQSACWPWAGAVACSCSATPPPAPPARRPSWTAWRAPGWPSGRPAGQGSSMPWRRRPLRRRRS